MKSLGSHSSSHRDSALEGVPFLEEHRIGISDSACTTHESEKNETHRHARAPRPTPAAPRVWHIFLCLVATLAGITYFSLQRQIATQRPGSCEKPVYRREWRSLSRHEKVEYIDAIQCLRQQPSKLGQDCRFSDFSYTHAFWGESSHETAGFLAWHRWFIHLYENALRSECGYNGGLVYWDWSLDWEDITQSLVWDTELGFGGDGNKSDAESVHGYCVTDGPFARLQVLYAAQVPYPHCLSRGFVGENIKEWGQKLSPPGLKRLFDESPDYATFNLAMEYGPHRALPKIIHGDFSISTAPSDPLFLLHHTQLDRLWWKWQAERPAERRWSYGGPAYSAHSNTTDLGDMLIYGNLSADIPVSEILETETTLLCYRYP